MTQTRCIISTVKGKTISVNNPNPYRMKQALRKVRLSHDEADELVIQSFKV